MASEDGLRERLGRKLTKRKAGDRKVSMEIPEHFRDGDDAHEDVTAPKGKNAAQYMHQSIFSMITAAGGGAQVNYQSRFDDDPSESEEDGDGDRPEHTGQQAPMSDGTQENKQASQAPSSSRRKSKLLRSIPRLNKMRRPKDQREPSTDLMSSSQILPPRKQSEVDAGNNDDTARGGSEAPVLSRMMTARAEMEEADPESPVHQAKGEVDVGTHSVASPVSLAQRLKEIFDFDEPEEVITEYPCWLLQTVLLQGYMYITQKHICFYAYLPRKEVSSLHPSYRTMLIFVDRCVKVWICRKAWRAKSHVQAILVPTAWRCSYLFYRLFAAILSKRPYRPPIRHIGKRGP